MKRIYHHYEKWEDWKDGLYRRSLSDPEELIVSRSVRLLSSPDDLLRAMRFCANNWKHSAEVNLSCTSRNRQAWLGQSACCLICGAPEYLTKEAWHRLSASEQDIANGIADQVIIEWEKRYAKTKHRNRCVDRSETANSVDI
jgi:hypothetical protein